MQKGKGSMGDHKHGVSGRAPKSPKLRLTMRLDAERDERKAKTFATKPTLAELLHPRKPRS